MILETKVERKRQGLLKMGSWSMVRYKRRIGGDAYRHERRSYKGYVIVYVDTLMKPQNGS